MLIVPVPMPPDVFVHSGAQHKCRHFVYRDGRWLAYVSKWKSRQAKGAAYAGGPTISSIQQGLAVLAERKRRRMLKQQYKLNQRKDA